MGDAATEGPPPQTDPASERTGMAQLLLMLLRIRVLLVVRYRMNFLAQIVSMYLFFAVIFFGGQAAAGSLNGGAGALGSTLDAVIVGWFLWTMAQSAYSSLSREITQESRWGTLEQLYISSYGFGVIIAGKMLVNMLMSLCIGGMMLALMLLTSGRSLALDLVTIVPLTTLALLSVVGLGFGFAGLTLVYKRISSISQLMQFALMGLVAAPRADVFVMNLLPLVKGSELLQRAMRSGVRLWEFPAAELGLLTGVAVVYSLGGYGVFRYCSNVARRRGVMGHY